MVAFLLPALLVGNGLALENRLYLPAAFLLLAVAVRLEEHQFPIPRLVTVGVVLIALLTGLTLRYAAHFRDQDRFTAAAVEGAPRSGLAHLNRGRYLHDNDRIEESRREYDTALSVDPAQTVVRNNLAVLFLSSGDFKRAEPLLRSELALNPAYVRAWYNLGLVLRELNRLEEAAAAWERALQLEPDNIDAIGELWVAYRSINPDRSREMQRRLEARGMKLTPAPVP